MSETSPLTISISIDQVTDPIDNLVADFAKKQHPQVFEWLHNPPTAQEIFEKPFEIQNLYLTALKELFLEHRYMLKEEADRTSHEISKAISALQK